MFPVQAAAVHQAAIFSPDTNNVIVIEFWSCLLEKPSLLIETASLMSDIFAVSSDIQ